MFSQDPRINPHTANVIDHSTNQPYARRTVRTIFGFALVLLAVGTFVGWFFSASWIPQPEEKVAVKGESILIQTPGNPYEADSGRGVIYTFFYNIFSGFKDGLSTERYNLNQADDIHKNVAQIKAVSPSLSGVSAKMDDGYKYSVFDIVGSDVIGRDGKNAGQVFDIFVHKETGAAKTIILTNDGARYGRDLARLKFENVIKQDADGDVEMMIAKDIIDDKPEFYYKDMNADEYVSLRHLRDGQVLDVDGNIAGQIDAIIYENAEAQIIYFKLKPALSPDGKSIDFGISFDAIQIVKRPDGFDVKLNAEQTAELAQALFVE